MILTTVNESCGILLQPEEMSKLPGRKLHYCIHRRWMQYSDDILIKFPKNTNIVKNYAGKLCGVPKKTVFFMKV